MGPHTDSPIRPTTRPNKSSKTLTPSSPRPNKLQFAGIEDVFTSSRGSTKTLGNFVKATFDCLMKTYGFLTPDFWRETRFIKTPYQEYTDFLAKPTKGLMIEAPVEKIEA